MNRSPNTSTAGESTPAAFPARRPEARPDAIAPGSSLYTMLSDATMLLYPLPAFLLPLLHPATADSTARHDAALADDAHVGLLMKRVVDTFEMVGAVVYGGPEADDVSFAIRELHRDVGGDVGGGAYHPWSRELWAWNWAAITAAVMDVYGSLARGTRPCRLDGQHCGATGRGLRHRAGHDSAATTARSALPTVGDTHVAPSTHVPGLDPRGHDSGASTCSGTDREPTGRARPDDP